MAQNDKVYHQTVIQDKPFPTQGSQITQITQKNTKQIYRQEVIRETSFPKRRIAEEIIGQALNTQARKILGEFEFGESGALQIGKYVSGTSGDLRITPTGIVARDSAGATTVSIDGETGDATFKGTVLAGSVVTGDVNVGDSSVIIDGANKRIIVNDGSNDRVLIGYQAGGF